MRATLSRVYPIRTGCHGFLTTPNVSIGGTGTRLFDIRDLRGRISIVSAGMPCFLVRFARINGTNSWPLKLAGAAIRTVTGNIADLSPAVTVSR